MKSKNVKRIVICAAASLALLALSSVMSLCFGSVSLTAERMLGALSGTDKNAAVILFDLRLPRLAAAILAGCGLSCAGFLLQTVTDNDLCAPNIVGVNSGAGLFVMLMLCFFPMQWRLQPFAAFLGALLAASVVMAVSHASSKYESKSAIVLSGVAVSSLLSAGISFLSLKFPDVLSSYLGFTVGGFSGVSFKKLGIPALMIVMCFLLSLILAPKISLLSLGDESAASLGVRVRRLRAVTVILASAMCAAVVSFAGLLGFVGLIVPHIIRRTVKENLRIKLIFSAVFGAILTSLSDLCGRTLFAPSELPAGLIMSLIGAPFFIYLLLRRRSESD